MVESINLDGWYPDYQTMQEIDQYLVNDWGIEYFLYLEQFSSKYQKIGRRKWADFGRLCKRQNEKLVTDAMSDFDIHALHVSQWRRTYILDLIGLTYSWMRQDSIAGKVIDIGCQNGVLLKFLAQKFPNQFVGVDPSSKAIGAARAQLRDLTNVELEVASLPLSSSRDYDLALCLDVLHHLADEAQAGAVRSILECLAPGGSAIIATQTFEHDSWWEAIQPTLSEFGCELIASGRVGGATRGGTEEVPADFNSTGVGIFKLTGNNAEIVDPTAIREKQAFYWGNFFAPYANQPYTPWNEKSLGFEAAIRKGDAG